MKKEEADQKKPDNQEDHGQDYVEITIKGLPKQIHRGSRTVAEIKALGDINPNHILVQIIDGKLVDLQNDGRVVIKGGEKFQSKPPVGDNS